jgi:hypothetical protein
MKVRANGLSLPDLDTLAALETGRYWTPDKRPGEALYRPAVNNGYWAEDIITDGLVLYVPCWLYSGAKFPSVDAYHHTCTVTGATWGPQGRTFNGVLNKIDCGSASSLDITGDITLEVWFKATRVDAFQRLINKYDGQNGYDILIFNDNKIYFTLAKAGLNTIAYTTAGDIAVNTWYHVFAARSGTVGKVYINGVDKTAASSEMADAGSYAGSVKLGIFSDSASYPFKGIKGEARIYNRGLVLAEGQHNRNVTRWRYA